MTKGLFITTEGLDGCGKTTQREFIRRFFEERGYTVRVTREPGGTPAAEELREFLLKPRQENISGKAEVLLFFAARAIHLQNMILPAIEAGEVVVCDRFVDSTYAYQAAGRGIWPAEIEPIEQYTLGSFKPDLTFIIDIEPTLSLKRAAARGKLDRIEAEAIEFFEKARLAFMARLHRDPSRYALIDGGRPVEQVSEAIVPYLNKLLATTEKEEARDQDTSRDISTGNANYPRSRA